MADEVVLENDIPRDVESDAVTVCKICGRLVPKTLMCLYCGSPILFKKIRQN